MIRKPAILLLLMLTIAPAIYGQDHHYSQYLTSQLNVNPALTGLFQGQYRFIGNYRHQWANLTVPFRTFSFSADMMLTGGLVRGDFIGGGLLINADKAGDSEFSTNQALVSFSYHKALSTSRNHFLAVGFQGGFVQRKFNLAKLTFDQQFNGVQFDPGIVHSEVFTRNNFVYPDMSAGLSWYYLPSESTHFYMGGAMYHMNQPEVNVLQDGVEVLGRKFIMYSGGKIALDEKTSMLPSLFYLNQGPVDQFLLGSYFGKELNHITADNTTTFYLGMYYRWDDSVILVSRLDYNLISFGFSYDITVSDVYAAGPDAGGSEISITYIVDYARGKKRRNIPVMMCPQF